MIDQSSVFCIFGRYLTNRLIILNRMDHQRMCPCMHWCRMTFSHHPPLCWYFYILDFFSDGFRIDYLRVSHLTIHTPMVHIGSMRYWQFLGSCVSKSLTDVRSLSKLVLIDTVNLKCVLFYSSTDVTRHCSGVQHGFINISKGAICKTQTGRNWGLLL